MAGDRSVARIVAPLGWAALLVAASRASWALEPLPALGVLRGPIGFALAALAVAVSAAHLLGGRRLASLHSRPRALFLAAAAVFVGMGLHYASRLRVSGDEPHYLLMAQSLWREHDLDLRDNFERGDFREFVPELPSPHYGAPRADGRPFPAHSPGLPLALAPAYALGGRAAAIVLLALAAAAMGLEVRALAERATRETRAALYGWAVAVGPPTAFYAFHVYTEVPSALALAVSLRLLLGGSPGVGPAALAALAASALPWLHVKMVPAAAALGLVGAVRLRGRARAAFLAVAAVMAAGYLAYYGAVFGRATPLALYGGMPRGIGASPPGVAAAGLLLDRSFGLLPCAPVFLLALAGLAWPRLPWREAWPHALVGLAVLAPVLTWRMWWGGQCPPARFLVPLVPVLAVGAAVRLAGPGRGLARWRWALLGCGAGLALVATARPEAMLLLNRRDRPTRLWDALSPDGGAQIGRYLPSLVSGAPAELRVAGLWIAAFVLLLVLDRLAVSHDRVDRLFRGLGLPLTLLVLIAALVDGWARRGAPEAPAEAFARAAPTAAARFSSRGAGASAPCPAPRRTARRVSARAPTPPRSTSPGGP